MEDGLDAFRLKAQSKDKCECLIVEANDVSTTQHKANFAKPMIIKLQPALAGAVFDLGV